MTVWLDAVVHPGIGETLAMSKSSFFQRLVPLEAGAYTRRLFG